MLSEPESNIGRWDADGGVFPDVDLDSDDPEVKEVRDAMSNILDKTSLADVIERAFSGQNVLNYVI